MKKILSIFLSVTLVVASLLSIPFIFAADTTAEPVLLLNSTNLPTDWLTGLQRKDGAQNGTWEDVNFRYDSSWKFWELPIRGYTDDLLKIADSDVNYVEEFEWTFEAKTHAIWTREAFLFNVDTEREENATVMGDFDNISNIKNCFAIVIKGSNNKNNYSTHDAYDPKLGLPEDSLRPNAINILVPDPNNGGTLVPLNAVDYTTAEVKSRYSSYSRNNPGMTLSDDDSFLELGADFALHDQYIKVKAQLIDNKLSITVTRGNASVSGVFTLPAASLSIAPGGDFAVTHGGKIDGTYDRANTTRTFRNMTIYEYPSNNYSYPTASNPAVVGGKTYFNNFDLSFATSFSGTKNAIVDAYFNHYLYGSEYRLSLDRQNGKVNLFKGNTQVATKSFDFKNGVNYQVIVSKNDGVINVYIYAAGGQKPAPTVTYTDSAPLESGLIYFSGNKGPFSITNVKVTSKDAAQVGNPFYTLDFENGMGDAQLIYGNKTLVTEGENTYLSVKRDNVSDGKSLLVLGPQDVGNFTINMDVRVTENTNVRRFYFSLRHHTNGTSLEDSYVTQILQRGTAIAAIDEKLGYNIANHQLGVSGPVDENSGYPKHDYNYGIHSDGEWHRVNIVSDGYTISVYIDGLLVVAATDAEQLYKKGGFAIYTWGINYDVDNIRIHSDVNYNLDEEIVQLGPTGVIFEKDFESDDRNMNGLDMNMGNTEKTSIVTDEDGNSFLRIIGSRTGYPDDVTGVNARSRIQFASNYIRNFDFTAKVRFKSAFASNWSYLSVAVRSDFSNYNNNAIWVDIGPRGSAIAVKNAELGLGTNNIVATSGNVSSTTDSSAYFPDDDRSSGLGLNGRWSEIKITARGHVYTLYIDGKKILAYTDPDQLYDRGAIYLYGYGINYDLDDIKITNYDPYTPNAAPLDNEVYSNKDETVIAKNTVTGGILAGAKVKNTKLGYFEWQFDYRADSASNCITTFMFHSNKNSKTYNSSNKLASNANIFGLALAGNKVNESNVIGNALTLLSPNQDPLSNGELLPVVYKKADPENAKSNNIPSKDAYLSLAASDTLAGIDTSKWMTINIRLIGNKLYVSVWQTDNKSATYRRQLFTVPIDALTVFSEGDFVISNGASQVYVKNMTIYDEKMVCK